MARVSKPLGKAKTIAPRPVLQWIAAGIGALATLAILGIILTEALSGTRPAQLAASVVSVRANHQTWVVEVQVSNTGSETATAVDIEAKSGDDTATATLDYVPGDGQATAFLAIGTDPSLSPVTVSVSGWSEP